jgi:hypothetical protein
MVLCSKARLSLTAVAHGHVEIRLNTGWNAVKSSLPATRRRFFGRENCYPAIMSCVVFTWSNPTTKLRRMGLLVHIKFIAIKFPPQLSKRN